MDSLSGPRQEALEHDDAESSSYAETDFSDSELDTASLPVDASSARDAPGNDPDGRRRSRAGSIASTYWRPERTDRKNLLTIVDEQCASLPLSAVSCVYKRPRVIAAVKHTATPADPGLARTHAFCTDITVLSFPAANPAFTHRYQFQPVLLICSWGSAGSSSWLWATTRTISVPWQTMTQMSRAIPLSMTTLTLWHAPNPDLRAPSPRPCTAAMPHTRTLTVLMVLQTNPHSSGMRSSLILTTSKLTCHPPG